MLAVDRYHRGWRDVVIIVLVALSAWLLIARSLEPNVIEIERTQKEIAQSQLVARSTENALLRAQVPTPTLRACPFYMNNC